MKRIAIFQRDLGIGGIQRSLLNLITNMDLSSYEVDLFLFCEPTICDVSDLKGVNVYILKPLFYLNRVMHIRVLQKLFAYDLPNKVYDLAIDYNSYSNECALCTFAVNARKRIMWIHNDVKIEYRNTLRYRTLWHFFKEKFYFYDEFVAVSGGIVEPFCEMTGIDASKIRVIPNSVNTPEIFRKSKEPINFHVDESKTNFIFVGRFTQQKGIDILIDDFARALRQRHDIHLYLLGSGPEELRIGQLIAKAGIEDDVTLLPAVDNPYPYMNQMDALILTSRHEGQGIVLWEAKSLGLDLIFPTRLEKYNDSLVGTHNVIRSILHQTKHEKHRDSLDQYNLKIKNSLYELFEK